MSKAQQSSDWGSAELTDAQLQYAASDVLYLHKIKDGLEAMLKREGRLMAHPGADVSAYPAGLHDPEGYYFSTKLITSGIVYNTASDAAPATWADLVEGPCAGKVAMPSPLTSGAATIHMATLTANPELGWDYYAKLAETGAVAQGGNGGTLKAVAGGEKLCGVVVDFQAVLLDAGARFGVAFTPGLEFVLGN